MGGGLTFHRMGRGQYVTSYSDTSGTTAVNQVKYEYNGTGLTRVRGARRHGGQY
jgi:hypothetical protein